MQQGFFSEDLWLVKLLSLAAFGAFGFFTLLSGSVAENLMLVKAAPDTQVAAVSQVTYPTLQSLDGLSDPSLAFGLSGISDWGSEMPFLNIMKFDRSWIGALPGQWGGWGMTELRDGGYLDEDGWITSMPPELEVIRAVFAWDGNTYGEGDYREGVYELTYEGEGRLEMMLLAGSQILSVEPGKIVFRINNNQGNWGFNIFETDPNHTGNYIRNIAIVKQEFMDLYRSGEIFNPDWIALIKDARTIRFMDWMNTNNSKMTSWDQMPTINSYHWSPAPIEVQVRLANEIGADPWFNIPFHADDNFVRTMAQYVQENLDPKLHAHVELSNEVWNWSFQQAQDAHKLAIAKWNLDPNNAGAGWVNYYGMRASQVMKIWTEVFGNETESRLVRVAGTQTVNPWLSEQILVAPKWRDNNPDEYEVPYTYFDVLSPTTYFGGGGVSNTARRTALLAAIADPNVDDLDWHYKMIKGEIPEFTGELPDVLKYLQEQRTVADKYGLKLMAYEGGQHVHHSAFVNISDTDLQALQQHLIAFIRSPQMALLYQDLWNAWKEIGTGPFMQFVDIGVPSKYGSWGLRASFTDTNPRAELLDNLNKTNPAWWESRGGTHFQQGRTLPTRPHRQRY